MRSSEPRSCVSNASNLPVGLIDLNRHVLLIPLVAIASLRLVAVFFLKPGGPIFDSIGDFGFYRELAELTLGGRWPYIDFWVEYPPLFPWILVAIYKLSLLMPGWPSITAPFHILLGLFFLACDGANALLVRRIAGRIWDPEHADRAMLMYAAQPIAMIAGLGWFDSFPLVFLLLAVEGAMARRAWLVGLALGLGSVAKIVPLVAGPAALNALRTPRRLLVAGLVGVSIVLIVVAPLVLSGSPFVAASLQATFERSSWENIWAFLEDYWRVGTAAPVRDRTVLDAAGRDLHASTLPWTLITGLHIAIMLALCFIPRERPSPRAIAAITGLGLLTTLFFARGYSPQFLVYLLPLLCIMWPGWRGVLYCAGLSVLSLIEWPFVLSLFPDRHDMIATIVIARTALWVVIAVDFTAEISFRFRARWRSVTAPVALVTGGAILVVIGWIGWTGSMLLPGRGEQSAIADHIRAVSAGQGTETIISSSRSSFYRLIPLFGEDHVVLGIDGIEPSGDRQMEAIKKRVVDGQFWIVLDQAEGEPEWRARLERELSGLGSRVTDRWIFQFHLIGFIVPDRLRNEGQFRPVGVRFGEVLELVSWRPIRESVKPGQPWRILLAWRVLSGPMADFKAFVHVLNERTDEIIAQDDRPFNQNGAGSGRWRPGELPITGLEPILPETLPDSLRLRIGVYDPRDGKRLLTGGTDHLDLPGPSVIRDIAVGAK